jgi:hypothetical protein
MASVIPEPELEPHEEPDLQDLGNFQAEIHRVYNAIHGNDEKRDLVLAEIHVFLSTLDQAMRKMMASGGPMAMLGNLVGGKKE